MSNVVPQVTIGCAARCGKEHQQPATRIAADYAQHMPRGWVVLSYQNRDGHWQESYLCSTECAQLFLKNIRDQYVTVTYVN